MKPAWDQKKVLRIVRDTIGSLWKDKRDWVLESELVETLLEDPQISRIADKAQKRGKMGGNKRRIVANMPGFLNHWVTRYENGTVPDNWYQFAVETHSMFERKRIRGRWAYKLRDPRARMQDSRQQG